MNFIMRYDRKKSGTIQNSRELFRKKFSKIETSCYQILAVYIANMNLDLLFKREKGKLNNCVIQMNYSYKTINITTNQNNLTAIVKALLLLKCHCCAGAFWG